MKRSLNNSSRDCGDINTNRDSVLESTHGTRRCAVSNVYHDEGWPVNRWPVNERVLDTLRTRRWVVSNARNGINQNLMLTHLTLVVIDKVRKWWDGNEMTQDLVHLRLQEGETAGRVFWGPRQPRSANMLHEHDFSCTNTAHSPQSDCSRLEPPKRLFKLGGPQNSYSHRASYPVEQQNPRGARLSTGLELQNAVGFCTT